MGIQVVRVIALGTALGLLSCSQPAPVPQPDRMPKPTPVAPATVSMPAPAKVVTPPSPEPPKASRKVRLWLKHEMQLRDVAAEKLRERANSINDYFSAGTAYNELDIPQHECYILGHLVGKPDAVKHLEIPYDSDLQPEGDETEVAQALRVAAISLENFSFIGEKLLKESPQERANEWNLDCVGQHDVSKEAWIDLGSSSFYAIKDNGRVLQILGDIEPGFAEKVRLALDANPSVTTVGLGSGGGHVSEAVKAGLLIRERGLTTVLWNNCYSACPLVFLAGRKRQIWSPYPALGFHQVYTQDGAVPLDSPVYRALAQYIQSMGADGRYVLALMWKAGPDEMNQVSGDDPVLCDEHVATWIQRRCDDGSS